MTESNPTDNSERSADSRYELVESSGKGFIVCSGAPGVRLYVERGLTVTESSRKRYAEQSIFLDGAYGDGPLFDNESRHYSLDHHEGCFRPITLATCEQAAVMIQTGLPLDEGSWQLYINEPDLDALLAAWLLINHAELLRDGKELLWRVMPLVRTEGTIDAHGLDHGAVSGLPEKLYEKQKSRVDQLLSTEKRYRAAGQWDRIDPLQYSLEMLGAFDRELFPVGYIERILDIVEVAQVPIDKRRSSAIFCRANQGIYAVEEYLKPRHEKRLGLILLDRGSGNFTLRQVDSFLKKDLRDLYPELNRIDSNVTDGDVSVPASDAGDDGETANRWGGSTSIGGSPRKTGTALSPDEILDTIEKVYEGGGWLRRFIRNIR